MATVELTFDAWIDGFVAPSVHAVHVAAARVSFKLEPVSWRLKKSLMHPSKRNVLVGLSYAPDGRQIIAGDYPGGIIQVWDAATGEQLTKIETGYGFLAQFQLTPDWRSVYVPREKRNRQRIEKDGKTLTRFEFDGAVRVWDLKTGELHATYQHAPPRNIRSMSLSPNGSSFLTGDQFPGEFEGRADQGVSVWNVATEEYRTLGRNLVPLGAYAPDGRTVAVCQVTDDSFATHVKLFDVDTGTETLSIPILEQSTLVSIFGFTPDGATLIANLLQITEGNNRRSSLRFWDAQSGREISTFVADEGRGDFSLPQFSPDGETLATIINEGGSGGKLYLVDLSDPREVKTIVLDDKSNLGQPAFSPDGKWVAAVVQEIPRDVRTSREPQVEDVPQPRIHLIDADAGEVRETIVAPQAFVRAICFSPDGKTLATGGHGKVLLWDLSLPPGAPPPGS